jgi:membrane fusion protein (multidrug efflux system)
MKILLGLFCLLFLITAFSQAPVFTTISREEIFYEKIEAIGTAKALESVNLSTNVSGIVNKVHFDDGQVVEAGQLLLEITNREQSALLKEAQSRLNEAKSQFNRLQQLSAEGNVSKALLDQQRREMETAQARLQAVQAQLADRVILAPFSGVLGFRQVSVGAFLSAGQTISTLDDISKIRLEFPVASLYLSKLTPGVKVQAKSQAFPNQVFQGVIRSVDSRIDPLTRAITVRALLDNDQGLLRPGLLMQVTIFSTPRKVQVIEESALQMSRNKYFLLTVENNVAKRIDVTIGQRELGLVEIVSPDLRGKTIIRDGMNARPGQEVRIVSPETVLGKKE